MSPPLDDDTDLPAGADLALQHLLAGQPGLPIPDGVRNRIAAALKAEAATRAALTANDAEPGAATHPLAKANEPVREADEVG